MITILAACGILSYSGAPLGAATARTMLLLCCFESNLSCVAAIQWRLTSNSVLHCCNLLQYTWHPLFLCTACSLISEGIISS